MRIGNRSRGLAAGRGQRKAWVVAALLAACARTTLAACTSVDVLIDPPVFPTLDVPADRFPVGTPLSDLAAEKTEPTIISCSGGHAVEHATATSLKPLSGVTWTDQGQTFAVFESSVPGIGYAIGIRDTHATEWIPLQDGAVQTFPAPGTTSGTTGSLGGSLRVWYIATGRLQTGTYTIPGENIVVLTADADKTDNSSPIQTLAYFHLNTATIEVTAQGCTVLDNNLSVDMQRVSTSAFKGVGSTGPARHFSIGLDCETALKLEINVDPSNAADAANGVVKLDAVSNSAMGIGVQLLDRDGLTPIPLGQDYKLFDAVEGQNAIDLSARYYQTENQVGPGVANATVNYTLRYR